MFKKISEMLFGKSKNPLERGVFQQISLVAVLAWVGFGANGLSSSSYGPEHAFRELTRHVGDSNLHLALYIVIATVITVAVISASYAMLIELFPTGGGGYLVASKLLGEKSGLVAGSALVVNYMLTISISIAVMAIAMCRGCDQRHGQSHGCGHGWGQGSHRHSHRHDHGHCHDYVCGYVCGHVHGHG